MRESHGVTSGDMKNISLSPETAARLQKSSYDFVVTGATGWLGRATLQMLYHALGEQFHRRVTALGARKSRIHLGEKNGGAVAYSHDVEPLIGWMSVSQRPLMVFHYAFLTKDKVGELNQDDYVTCNDMISAQVGQWVASGQVRCMVVPSSGAVYDYLRASNRDLSAGLYGKLKYLDELRFSEVCQANGSGLVIPRVFNLSGPYINKLKSYALASFIVQALQQGVINIYATRAVVRSYYFIGDLVQLCVHLLMEQQAPHINCFDVAGDETIELSALARRALFSVGADPTRVVRQPLHDHEAPDIYLGDPLRIRAIERGLGIIPMALERQIDITRLYIAKALKA